LIKAIVFDFDGLIIDTETAWYASYRESLSEQGFEFPLEVFAKCVGTHDHELIRYFGELLGSAHTVTQIRQRAAEIHDVKMNGAVARDGVREFLEEAGRLGLRIGLATSSSRAWIDRFLHALDLAKFFEAIKTSDDVTNIKPDPELYLHAVEALGVQPAEALAFEDSLNGSRAAVAAGLRCVIVPNPVTEHLPFEKYDLRIRSMGEHTLEDIILRLNVEE
jgi:putative hydrolase of the HAD superfamily